MKKSLTMKRPETFLLAMIGLFFYIFKLPEHFSSKYMLFYYLSDYSFGFIKRGLIGQLLSFTPIPITESFIISFNILLIFILILIIIKIFEKINFKNRVIEYLLILFLFTCPSLLKNIWYDMKFDIIGILYCALVIALPNRFNKILLIFSSILLFVHEGFLFLWIPTILSCIWIKGNLSIKKNYILFFIYFLLIGGIMIIIKLYGDIDVDINTFISHIKAKLPPSEMEIPEVPANLMTGNVYLDIKLAIYTNFSKIKFWGYGTTILVSVFVFMKFISDLYNINLKTYIYNIILPLISIFFMFFLGWDALRWFSNMTFSIFFVFITILLKNTDSFKNTDIDYTNYKFQFIIALILLYIPFNNMGVIHW